MTPGVRFLKVRLALLVLVVGTSHGFGDSPFYTEQWCDDEGAASLVYLDDSECNKVFPSSFDRDFSCPLTTAAELDPAVWVSDSVPLVQAPVDNTTLEAAGVPADVQLCLILVKRLVATGELRTRRLCAGGGERVSHETWSSSKFLAVGNAAGQLREECGEAGAQQHALGLEANTTYTTGACSTADGRHGVCIDSVACATEAGEPMAGYCTGPTVMQCCVGLADPIGAARTPLGDLATVVASYDTTAGLTSNSVASFFHDLGHRDRARTLATDWLAVPSASAAAEATLGGNYGEDSPDDLGFELVDDDTDAVCAAEPDPADDGPFANSLTALALAEAHRRLALHRELLGGDAGDLVFPNTTWVDARELLYGAEQSVLFPGVVWGGLSTDPAIFLQTGVEQALEATGVLNHGSTVGALAAMDEASGGQWRIFSKLGAGYSSSRSVGEVLTAGYGCIPAITGQQGGWEFTLAARGSVSLDFDLAKAEAAVLAAVEAALVALALGDLD